MCYLHGGLQHLPELLLGEVVYVQEVLAHFGRADALPCVDLGLLLNITTSHDQSVPAGPEGLI